MLKTSPPLSPRDSTLCEFRHLPTEMREKIFAELRGIINIFNACLVCSHWNNDLQANLLWKSFYLRDFGPYETMDTTTVQWKEVYKRRHCISNFVEGIFAQRLFKDREHPTTITSLVRIVRITPFLCSGSLSPSIAAWNLQTGEPDVVFKGHAGEIMSLVNYNNNLISASADGTIKFWNFEDDAKTLLSSEDSTPFIHLDNDTLVIGDDVGNIVICNLKAGTKENLPELPLPDKTGSEEQQSSDSDCADVDFRRDLSDELETDSAHLEREEQGLGSREISVTLGSRRLNSRTLETQDITSDDEERLPDDEFHQERLLAENADRQLSAFAFGQDRLFIGSLGKQIYVWDTVQKCYLPSLLGHEDSIIALIVDGKTLISGSSDKTIKLWNLDTHQCIATLDNISPVMCLADAGNGIVFAGSQDGIIRIWDTLTQKCVQEIQVPQELAKNASYVSTLSYEEKVLYVGYSCGVISVMDFKRL